jgi:hypothetical protein
MKVNSVNMNTYKMVVFWMILLLILLYSSAHAAETISAGKAEVPQKETAGTLLDMLSGGSASILENIDIEEAKEKALEKAKNEAVLKVIGLYVNSETLSKEKTALIKGFSPKQNEIISEYKIVSEERGEDGFYRVKISSKIREDAVKALLMLNLKDDRVIVITSEKNMRNVLKRNVLEHELIQKIKGKGYTIVDYRTVKNRTVNKLVSLIRQGNTEAVKKLGIYYLTDYVVAGFVETEFSQKTKDIYSAQATGQVKIHQIGNKKEIVSLTNHNMKGFGSNADKAGIDAIKKISDKMAEGFIKDMPGKSVKKITLKIKEIGSYASFRKAKKMISDIPYVKDVKDGARDFDIEETTLYIKTTKGVDYIAEKISELRKFVVMGVGVSDITVEARKI